MWRPFRKDRFTELRPLEVGPAQPPRLTVGQLRGAAHEIAGSGALLAEDRLLGGRQLLQGRRAQRPKLVLFESVYVDTAFGSDEPDSHSTHTEHDHRRNDPGDDRTADHESVGERLADAMRHNDRTRPSREMR
jgi:hypothetical protein